METAHKNNLAPFWWLLVLTLVVIVFNVYTIRLILSRFPDSDIVRFPSPLLVQATITIVALTAECVMYYLLRHKLLNRLWVKCHVSMLYVALAVLPILYSIVLILIRPADNDLFSYRASMGTLLAVRMFIYWSLVIIAHVFFIMTLIKGFARQAQEELPEGEPDILDDFRQVQ